MGENDQLIRSEGKPRRELATLTAIGLGAAIGGAVTGMTLWLTGKETEDYSREIARVRSDQKH